MFPPYMIFLYQPHGRRVRIGSDRNKPVCFPADDGVRARLLFRPSPCQTARTRIFDPSTLMIFTFVPLWM